MHLSSYSLFLGKSELQNREYVVACLKKIFNFSDQQSEQLFTIAQHKGKVKICEDFPLKIKALSFVLQEHGLTTEISAKTITE